jgi:hypothetical protein
VDIISFGLKSGFPIAFGIDIVSLGVSIRILRSTFDMAKRVFIDCKSLERKLLKGYADCIWITIALKTPR